MCCGGGGRFYHTRSCRNVVQYFSKNFNLKAFVVFRKVLELVDLVLRPTLLMGIKDWIAVNFWFFLDEAAKTKIS